MAQRILIKLSGEGLAGLTNKKSIDFEIVKNIAKQIKQIQKFDNEIAIVVGGGNFWRGASTSEKHISRNNSDYIGMLATIMNAIALQSVFEEEKISTKIQSSIRIDEKVVENYVNEKAIKYLEEKKVVIFAGGTGRPFFTTDTASTLVAAEINADLILMGKNKAKGVYDSDPRKNPNAKKFDKITYDQILKKGLSFMDSTATSMASENNIKIIVFDITEENAILKAVQGKIEHTEVIK